jgi:hypothetical protein
MEVCVKRLAGLSVVLLFTASLAASQEPEGFDRPDASDDNVTTGPAVGEEIPGFQAVDQNGALRDFETIKGPRGALLLFHRSADW